MTCDLETLAGTFPPGARGLRAIVLREFTLIKAARGKGWAWQDIARALGLPDEKEHGLAETFRRVRLAVEAGRLDPERPAVTREQKATPEPEQASNPVGTTAEKRIPPRPGSRVTRVEVDPDEYR